MLYITIVDLMVSPMKNVNRTILALSLIAIGFLIINLILPLWMLRVLIIILFTILIIQILNCFHYKKKYWGCGFLNWKIWLRY